MSEKRFQLLHNGQQVITGDFNLLGETSGFADERVFAELFRLAPFDGSNVARGILPFRAHSNENLIVPNGASGSVRVKPFRAMIGTRTAVGSGALANWRDTQSAVMVGSTTLDTTVSFAIAGLNPRWDLIYATVTVDANGPSITRKIKDPATKAIAGTSVATYKQTTVTIGVFTGTASATPSFPALPADAGGSYRIPLGYVLVSSLYNGTTTFAGKAIAVTAPVLSLAASTGAATLQVANAPLTTAQQQAWGSAAAPPRTFIPSSVGGSETLLLAFDYEGTTSHPSGTVLDTRDWRGRLCFWSATLASHVIYTMKFPWDPTLTDTAPLGDPTVADGGIATADYAHGTGQSIVKTTSTTTAIVCALTEHNSSVAAGTAVIVVSDHADGGKLKVLVTGNPGKKIILELRFTGPFGATQ